MRLEDLWSSSEDVKEAMPLLNRAEQLERGEAGGRAACAGSGEHAANGFKPAATARRCAPPLTL
jgi:hypothetical protein